MLWIVFFFYLRQSISLPPALSLSPYFDFSSSSVNKFPLSLLTKNCTSNINHSLHYKSFLSYCTILRKWSQNTKCGFMVSKKKKKKITLTTSSDWVVALQVYLSLFLPFFLSLGFDLILISLGFYLILFKVWFRNWISLVDRF